MATQVRDTAAGQSISAWVILNKKGQHIATVNAHYSNGGRVSVDVWNLGDAVQRCLDAAIRAGVVTDKTLEKVIRESEAKRDWEKNSDRHTDFAAYDLFGMQQSSASGYGYDKFAAALSGLWIDGQQMADHCGTVANAEKARKALFAQYCKFHDYSSEATRAAEKGWDRKHWDKRAQTIGASFANYSTEQGRFTSLHFTAGLDRLIALGYTVVRAI